MKMPPAEYWGVDRIDIGDGESIPTHTDAIRPGDQIIHYTLRWPLQGKVISRGMLIGKVDGFMIETVQGKRDFIEADQAQILGIRYATEEEVAAILERHALEEA